ncbi:MAG: hypothetical protein R3F17_06955 [Planctomycetota bacterium]
MKALSSVLSMSKNKLQPLRLALALTLAMGLGTWVAWAKGGPGEGGDDLAAGGDSVGTLPLTNSGGSFGNSDPFSAFSMGADLHVLVRPESAREILASATGTGQIRYQMRPDGFLDLHCLGDVDLLVGDDLVEQGAARFVLVNSGDAAWAWWVSLGGWNSAAMAGNNEAGIELPVLRALNMPWGNQSLTVATADRSNRYSALTFQRGAGMVHVRQAMR